MQREVQNSGGGATGNAGRRGQQRQSNDEKELISKFIRLQNKHIYLDVKENNRGKFFKITEIVPGGYKSRVLMSLVCASLLGEKLQTITNHFNDLPPLSLNKEQDNGQQTRYPEKRICSESIVRDNRYYYIDLNENRRGRFLRIVQVTQTQRSQVLIPGQNLAMFKEAINEVLQEIPTEDLSEENQLVFQPKSLRVDRKMYYFDVDSRISTQLRISEVHPTFRTAITIPSQKWTEFRDVLTNYVDLLNQVKTKLNNDQTIEKPSAKMPSAKPHADGDVVQVEE